MVARRSAEPPPQQPVHPLELIFADAVAQATTGKGQRHGGDNTPFYEQAWVHLANVHGHRFLTGQAEKKLIEATVSGHAASDLEAYEREVLGAIVYLGMALLYLRDLPAHG